MLLTPNLRIISFLSLLSRLPIITPAVLTADASRPKSNSIRSASQYQNDPNSWCTSGQYPACCGKAQSPIDIFRSRSTRVNYKDLIFTNYKEDRIAVLVDDGHSVVINMKKTPLMKDATVSGGNLKSTYVFSSLHFHWGPDDDEGSEHTIDKKSYPLEMHLVHYNAKYGGKEKCLDKSDGLLVLGVMFEICKPGDRDYFSNLINKILRKDIYLNETYILSKELALMDFLPDDVRSYFTYQGSLTTPPCNEIVTWIVFEDTLCIKEKQMTNFRSKVHSKERKSKKLPFEDDVIHDNHRPNQPLGTRTVFWNT